MRILTKYIIQESFKLIYCALVMPRIEHTNIIIDEFSFARCQTNRAYSYILTHIHTDHLKGLHDGWCYGTIYCSAPTKELLEYKFPNIQNVVALELQTPKVIQMSPFLSVTVTFFDANHCIGAVMVLMQGHMGTVLYSGDMRFDRDIFKNYKGLYPPDKLNERFEGCSKQIDVLYVDNTFLKKKFDFPPKPTVLKMAVDFIQQILNMNKHSRVYIGLDSFGKEEVLVQLAQHFNMYIVLDNNRYEQLHYTPLDMELFTVFKSQGVVEVVRKSELYTALKDRKLSIGMILSGWVNQPTYRFNETIYCLPYSLHSNYREIHAFVNSIRPTVIYPIVHQFPDQNKLFYAQGKDVSKRDLMFNQSLFEEQPGNYKAQIEELRRLFCSPPTEAFRTLETNIQLQKKIDQQLCYPNLENIFTSQKITPVHMQVTQRKKYKLSNNRNELQINRLKNQIQLKKRIIEGEPIQIIDDDGFQPISSGDSVNNKKQMIAIDEDRFQAMDNDFVEVDPLFQPIRNKRKSDERKKQVNAKKQWLDSKQNESIRSKIKEKELKSQTLQQYLKRQKKTTNTNAENVNLTNVPTHQSNQIEEENALNECSISKIKTPKAYRGINFEQFKQIKVLKKKEDTLNHLKQQPEELELIQKILKTRQCLLKK